MDNKINKPTYDELAAENVRLKSAAEFATAPDMWVEQADGMLDYRYHEWYVDVLKAAMETPATDAYLSQLRNEARADAFAYAADSVRHEITCLKERSPTLKEMACLANEFDSTAMQLREGKAGEVV